MNIEQKIDRLDQDAELLLGKALEFKGRTKAASLKRIESFARSDLGYSIAVPQWEQGHGACDLIVFKYGIPLALSFHLFKEKRTLSEAISSLRGVDFERDSQKGRIIRRAICIPQDMTPVEKQQILNLRENRGSISIVQEQTPLIDEEDDDPFGDNCPF